MLFLHEVCILGNRFRSHLRCPFVLSVACKWNFDRYQVKVMSWLSLNFSFRIFSDWVFDYSLKLRLVGWQWFSFAHRRERGSRMLARELSVGQVCGTRLLQVQTHFHFTSIMRKLLHEHGLLGRCCIAKLHDSLFICSTFSRRGRAETLTLVVGLQSEPKLWPW